MIITVKLAKVNRTVDFDVNQLPPASVHYALTYGLTQAMNDAHASVQRKNCASDVEFQAAVDDKVAKRLDQILSGNVPGTRQPADTKTAGIRKAAKELEAAGVDASNFLDMTDEERAAIARIFAKRAKKAA